MPSAHLALARADGAVRGGDIRVARGRRVVTHRHEEHVAPAAPGLARMAEVVRVTKLLGGVVARVDGLERPWRADSAEVLHVLGLALLVGGRAFARRTTHAAGGASPVRTTALLPRLGARLTWWRRRRRRRRGGGAGRTRPRGQPEVETRDERLRRGRARLVDPVTVGLVPLHDFEELGAAEFLRRPAEVVEVVAAARCTAARECVSEGAWRTRCGHASHCFGTSPRLSPPRVSGVTAWRVRERVARARKPESRASERARAGR